VTTTDTTPDTDSQPTVDPAAAAYQSALLARVATLDGGAALALVLESVLERLGRIEEFCCEAQEAIAKYGTMKLPFGLTFGGK
jgi:hypothetical protein